MITGWRSARRIGAPSFVEWLRGKMFAPLLAVGGGAAAATLVFLIKLAFGGGLWSQLIIWRWSFLIFAGFMTLQLVLGRRWTEAAIAAGLTALVFFIAGQLAVPIFTAISGIDGPVIIPVTP